MDYDHYYFKLEQLRGKPNADPNKVIRVCLFISNIIDRIKTSFKNVKQPSLQLLTN